MNQPAGSPLQSEDDTPKASGELNQFFVRMVHPREILLDDSLSRLDDGRAEDASLTDAIV